MKNCKIISRTNSAESILEKRLFNLANGIESLHKQYSDHFNDAQFIEEFGDYVQYSKDKLESADNIDPSFEKRLDENGEPKLLKDSKKNTFYYLNKDNKKVYFPQKLKQLDNIISDEDIQTISTQLAYDYLNNNFGMLKNFTDINLDVELSTTLKESIYAKMQSKIQELKESDDFGDIARLAVLEEIADTKYLDEWVDQTKNRFKVIKLNYVEETEIDQLEELEEIKDPTYGKSSVEKSYKVNINTDVKLMLSFIPKSTYENGKIVPVLDFFFQEPVYESFDNVYGYLLGELSTVRAEFNEDIFEKYKEHLAKKIRFKPYLKYLLQQFETEQIKNDENFKNSFVQSFTLDRQALLVTTIEHHSDGTFTVTTQNVSEVGSRGKMILNEWGVNFAEKFISKGVYVKPTIEKAEKTLLAFQQGIKDITLDNFNTKKQELQKILKAFKFDVTLEGLDHYIFDTLDDVTDEAVRDRFDDLTQGLSWLLSGMSKGKIKPSENVPSSQKQINDLAKSEAVFTEDGSDASIYTKKNLWVFTKPSYISNRIKSWINNPQLLKQHIESSAFNKGSVIGKYLLALDNVYNNPDAISKERLSKFKHGIFNLMQQANDARNGVDSKEISKNDKIVEYINKILSPIKGEEMWVDTPTPADKITEISLNYGNFFVRSNVSIVNTKLESISDQVKDIAWEYYVSEYNRMKEVATKIKESEESGDSSDLIVHYHLGNKNGLRSQLFPSLAPQFTTKGKVSKLPEFDGIHLFDNNGYPLTLDNGDYINLNVKDADGNFLYKDQIVNKMLPVLEREIRATAHRLMGNKIIEFDTKNNVWKNNLLDSKVFDSYNKESGRQAGANIAADIFINGIIQQVEYSKLFSGDVAYYKDIVDYKKRIPATYTDGLQLVRLGLNEQNFNLSVIGGVKIPATNMEELKKILPKEIWEHYENNNSTDAQGWITPQRWKFLMTKLGKWNSKYDTVYDKIMGRNNKPFTTEELKMSAQPLKGVYFEVNEQGVPVYLKYSQAVLIPRFIKNTPLQKVYDKMIEGTEGKDHVESIEDFNKQTHELVTIDGVKVGAINPENIHNNDGSLNPDFKLNRMSLKNSGWKLQQDLPTKGVKDTMIGTQIQKNIFQGLAHNLKDTFSFQGKDVTGEYIAKEINRVVGELSNIGLQTLKQELGLDNDGRITDLDSFYSALADQMIERDAPTNIVEALQANLSPLAIPQSYSKIMNMFASLVQKRVIKITTNGGSFIQVSEFGMNNTTAKEKGVIWTPWAENTTNHYTVEKDADGNDIKDALGRLKIKPASLLIPASLIAKYVPDWASKKPSELFGTKDKNYTNGIIDKRILENIIGYRIPNQGLSSNDAFSIAGILPEGMGDSVIAYTGITTKTGSDFDIDKMFLMVPSFENKDGKLKYVDSNKNSKAGYQNRLIELYKATILNPNVIKDVMQPLDFDYMSNDQKAFVPKESIQDLDVFNPLKDIDTKFDFKAGKTGVGMEANALMDFVRGTMSTLTLMNFELTKGNKLGNNVKLDNEYSQELTKQELLDYMELYNAHLPEGATKLTKKTVNELASLKIGNSLSAILNAFVDIAKDNYITKANWNTFTTNTANLLLRAGVHPFIVNGFIAQPIIKKYVEFVNSNESITVDNTGNMFFKFKNELVSENLNKLRLNLPSLNINVGEFHKNYIKYEVNEKTLNKKLSNESLAKELKVKADNPDLQKLRDSIRQEYSKIFNNNFRTFQYNLKNLKRDSVKEYDKVSEIEQLQVLEEFNRLQEASKNVKDNVQASRTDTEGYGKNIPALFAKINLVNKILNKEAKGEPGALSGFLSKMSFKNADSMLAHYTRNGVDFIQSVMENNSDIFTIAHKFILNTFNEISIDAKGDLLTDVEFGTTLENKYVSYMLSGFRPFQMTSEVKNEMIRNFPDEFTAFKNEHKQDYLILQELFVEQGEFFKFVVKSNKNKSSAEQNLLTNSWRRLLEDHPEMGENLIKYSYLTSGFEMTKNQFFTLIPYQWFLQNDINTYLKENVDNLLEVDPHFISQLYRNNAKDNVLVRQVFFTQKENSSAEGFKLKTKEKKANYYKKEIVKDKNDKIIGLKLYELQGYDAEFQPIYIRVNPLGHSDRKGNKIVNYQFNTTLQNKQKGLTLDQNKIDKLLAEVQYPYDYYHKQMYNQAEMESNVDKVINEDPSETVKVNEVYEKIDDNAYSINLNYKGRDYNMVIDRDGEVVNPNFYNENTHKDIDVSPRMFNFTQAQIDYIFNMIESQQDVNKIIGPEGQQLQMFQQLNQQEIQDVFEQYSDRINKGSLIPMTLQEFMEATKEFKTKQELIDHIEKCYPV